MRVSAVFTPLQDRVCVPVSRDLHLTRRLNPASVAFGESENFVAALIATGLFALYERRRVDSYEFPVSGALGRQALEGAAAGVVVALLFAADHYFFKPGENVWDGNSLAPISLLQSNSMLRTGTLWFAAGFHVAFDDMQLFTFSRTSCRSGSRTGMDRGRHPA